MRNGDGVLARLWQADEGMKLHPTVLLCRLPPFGDWLACGVSSQLRHYVPDFDELIGPENADFAESGLRQPSLVRLGFASSVPSSQIGGALGRIASARLQRLRRSLAHLLHKESEA